MPKIIVGEPHKSESALKHPSGVVLKARKLTREEDEERRKKIQREGQSVSSGGGGGVKKQSGGSIMPTAGRRYGR